MLAAAEQGEYVEGAESEAKDEERCTERPSPWAEVARVRFCQRPSFRCRTGFRWRIHRRHLVFWPARIKPFVEQRANSVLRALSVTYSC